MKIFLILVAGLAILGAGFLFFQNSKHLDNPSTSQNQSDSKKAAFCIPSQLEGSANSEGAAGNVYVTVTIKNISTSTCKIIGNNTLQLGYPDSVTNFQTAYKGQPATSEFHLSPNQTIYSLIHYPNGPQCSSAATDVNAMVSYQISSSDSITFAPSTGPTLDIPSCDNANEVTTIDLYPFSDSPVTP